MTKPNLNAHTTGVLTAKDPEDFAEARKGLPLRPLRKTLRSLRLTGRAGSFNLVAGGCFNKEFTMILIKIYAEPLKPGSPKPTPTPTSPSQKP